MMRRDVARDCQMKALEKFLQAYRPGQLVNFQAWYGQVQVRFWVDIVNILCLCQESYMAEDLQVPEKKFTII
jgi:hypothetical protein